MSRRRRRLLFLAELSKEMFIKIQFELSLTNSAFLVLPFFKRQISRGFFKVVVFLLDYIDLICATYQEQVSLFMSYNSQRYSVTAIYWCLLLIKIRMLI